MTASTMPDEPLVELRDRLRQLHMRNGMPSYRELAKLVARNGGAISQSTVGNVLRCDRVPKWRSLELVVQALDEQYIDEFRQLWEAAEMRAKTRPPQSLSQPEFDSDEDGRVTPLWQMGRVQRRLLDELGREAVPEELAKEMDITPERVLEIQQEGRANMDALVRRFETLTSLADPDSRLRVVAQLRPGLARGIPFSTTLRRHVEAMVWAVYDTEGGIDELVDVVRRIEGDTADMSAVAELVAELTARGVVMRRVLQMGAYPGYLSDTNEGEDLLGRMPEIEAMATLLASRDTEPPLSVGLFGDWGSGKTFFLDKLRREIRFLADMSASVTPDEDSAMCAEIRQVVFNAWHYTDANLWASLVAAIFAELAEPRHGENRLEAQQRWTRERDQLVSTLETTRQHLHDAQAHLDITDAEVTRLQDALEELERRRREGRNALATMAAVADVVFNDPRVQRSLNAARSELDLQAGTELEQLRRFADDSASSAHRLSRAWRLLNPDGRRGVRWRLWLAGSVAAVMCVSVPLLLQRYATTAVQLLAGFIALIAPLALAGQRTLGILGRALRMAETAADAVAAVERQVDERRTREETQVIDELRQIEAEQTALKRDVLLAQARVDEARRALDDAKAGRLLTEFVHERSGSADYRSQLGIVAMIRRDFDRLAELLGRSWLELDGRPPIERIVLYVDDLDRCTPDRVVEVLQAVHLLLGLDLFVVVVAVDPRWLLGSLELHYERVLGRRDGPQQANPAHWAATPTNYLEKIFQIPYNLSRMNGDDFGRLVDHLQSESQPVTTGGAPGTSDSDSPDEPTSDHDTPVDSPKTTIPAPNRDIVTRLRPPSLILSVNERRLHARWHLSSAHRVRPNG